MRESRVDEMKLLIALYDHEVEEGLWNLECNVVYYAFNYMYNDELIGEEVTDDVSIPDCDWVKLSKPDDLSYQSLKQILNKINERQDFWVERNGRNYCLKANEVCIEIQIGNVSTNVAKQLAKEYFGTEAVILHSTNG